MSDDLQQSSRPGYQGPDGDDGGVSIDFGRLIQALKKYFWIILLFLIVGLIGAVAYLNVATPIYQSVAVLKVEQREVNVAPLMSGSSMATGGGLEDLRALEMVATIQRGFTSRSLMGQVLEKLDLINRPGFLPKGIPADDKQQEAVELLVENTTAQVIRGTRLIQISYDHPNPETATEIVGALIREYVALDIEQRLKAASGSLDYLQRERTRIEKQLRESEQKLSEYTSKLGSVSAANEMNIIAEQLRELNSRITVAKTDRLKLEADFEQIENVRDDPDALLQVTSIAAVPEIQSSRTQLNEIDGEIGKTRQRYGAQSPQLKELLSQRKGLAEALNAQALRAPRSVEIALRAAIQNEKSLEKETQAQERKTIDMQSMAIQSSVLQRQIDADKIAYEAVLQRLNEEQSQARSQPVFLQVQDPPSPGQQVKPRPLLVAAVALILSLGAGIAIVVALALMDTSFKSADEVEAALGVHVVAAIPQHLNIGKGKKAPKVQTGSTFQMPTMEDHHSAVSEAFRTLRASFLMAGKEHPLILMTSAVPGEGKSYCSLNLAIAFAQQESSTLIIDADLRKPVIEERLFGKKKNLPGLSDYLMGRVDIDDIIRETDVPSLFVITAGRHYSNPSELLLRRERFQELLNAAESRFQRTVVDSAPVLAVSDTLNLARHFKTVGLVVRSHKTPRRLSQRAADLLTRGGNTLSGVVLNLVPARGAGYYYYYSYGRGGRSYGAPDPEPAGQTS